MVLLLIIAGAFVFASLLNSPMVTGEKTVDYSEFKSELKEGHMERVVLFDTYALGFPTDEGVDVLRAETDEDEAGMSPGVEFKVWKTNLVKQDESLVPLLEEHNVEFEAQPESGCNGEFLLIWILPLLLIFFFWSYMLRRMQGGGGPNAAMSFGKSNAKLNMEQDTGVTFDDVAGCDEAKEELEEIIHFLKEPGRFTRLGGKVPKGVLLVGPPGTGKTLLARAIAGEADVPFFNLSGSDFVEMFVGVGAARVRDLFKQAQEHSPCIVFVDELDAIGKSRGNAMQSNEEREQTLNALLVEMDGFDANTNVILLAATNRPEVLDPALLRAGRFDRQVVVDRPDVRGREAILKVHARGVIIGGDVDLELVAQQTPGFVGADLANIVNEAALLAARHAKDAVEMTDFQAAIERVIAGLEKKSRRLGPKEKNIVAYHESGHAIVSQALEATDKVHKVSIVSRGMAALGYTLQLPTEDRYLMTLTEIKDKICGLLGGRAAEDIIFGDISTGASNDLQRVTELARKVVVDFGMSDSLGNVSYGSKESYLGDMPLSSRKYSEQTAIAIDDEVQGMVRELYEKTVAILRENHDVLVDMSEELKDVEVLEGDGLGAFLERVRPYTGLDGTDGVVHPTTQEL